VKRDLYLVHCHKVFGIFFSTRDCNTDDAEGQEARED
jgi:hypothetical protein